MPETIMTNLKMSTFDSIKEVFKISKALGISSFALIYRAFNMDRITLDKYRTLKASADKEFEEYLIREEEKKIKQKDKKKGGPNPYLVKIKQK